MKLSIITVTLNSKNTIISTLNSILSQTYKNIEHIIVDGGSTDGTIEIVKNYTNKNSKIIISEGAGIYEAMNIGIENSTGEIISILNSDDIYQNESIISEVMEQIKRTTDKDIFLGDVVYFRNTSFYDIYRYYKSKNFERWHLRIGLMPPHPPSFIRKKIYDNFGLYNTGFKIASDFEIFLRFIYVNKINFHKLNKIVVRMRMGGISGKNFQSYIISTQEILQSYKINKIKISLLIVLLRLPPKLLQYFLFSKEKLNHNYRLFKLKFGMEFLNGAFKIIKRIDQIPYEKNFILSGLNLAFLGYYFKNQIPYHESIYHWPDGLFAKSIFDNIEKFPEDRLSD